MLAARCDSTVAENSISTRRSAPARSLGNSLVPSRFHSSGGIAPVTRITAALGVGTGPGCGSGLRGATRYQCHIGFLRRCLCQQKNVLVEGYVRRIDVLLEPNALEATVGPLARPQAKVALGDKLGHLTFQYRVWVEESC